MRHLVAFFLRLFNIVLSVIAWIGLHFYTPWHLRGYVRGISRAVKAEVQRQKLGAERLYAFLSLKTVF
jgi:hypothetical protein